jgi:peptide/nickel transport system substrate-binding protein
VPGDKIALKANENYHGAGTGVPKYKNILFKPIKSGPARIAALLAKDVDFIDNVPPLNVAKMKKNPTIQ